MSGLRKASALRLGGTLLLVMSASAASAQAPELPDYLPYAGASGYQEIALPGDAWYVAFHGTRKHGLESVQAGWSARTASVCKAAGKTHFVELRYVDEPVRKEGNAPLDQPPQATMRKTAGAVYIPIFIPSGPREISPFITPSKLAPALCVTTPELLKDPARAQSVDDALATARKLGLKIP